MKETIKTKNLIALRGRRSQEEVAQAIGISTTALSMYESGKRMPRDEIKLRLFKYYHCSRDEIFLSKMTHYESE